MLVQTVSVILPVRIWPSSILFLRQCEVERSREGKQKGRSLDL